MNAIAYNVALVLGIVSITAGVALRYGTPDALITVGALMIGLTVVGAYIVRGR